MYSGKKTLADTEQQKLEKPESGKKGRMVDKGNKERGGQGYMEMRVWWSYSKRLVW